MDTESEKAQLLGLAADYEALVPSRKLELRQIGNDFEVKFYDAEDGKYLATLSKNRLKGNLFVEMVAANKVLNSMLIIMRGVSA